MEEREGIGERTGWGGGGRRRGTGESEGWREGRWREGAGGGAAAGEKEVSTVESDSTRV